MTTGTEHITRFSDGDIVRMSRPLTDDESWVVLPHRSYPDTKITIEQFFEAGDPEQNEIPVDFYEAVDEHGCSVVVPADAVELVMTASQAETRRMPDPGTIAKAVQSAITSMYDDGIDIDETIVLGNEVEAYGRTSDGLTFGFRVTVSKPWRTDA